MAATVTWYYTLSQTNVSPTWVALSGGSPFVRYKKANNNDEDLLNPLVRPASGNDYSWKKAKKIVVSAGGYSQLQTLQFAINGTPVTGLEYAYKFESALPADGVGTAVASASDISGGYQIVTLASYATWTNAATLTGGGAQDPWGDFLMTFARVGTSVVAGNYTSHQLSAQYDEI